VTNSNKFQINSNYTPSNPFLQPENADFSDFFLYFSRMSAIFSVFKTFLLFFRGTPGALPEEENQSQKKPAPV